MSKPARIHANPHLQPKRQGRTSTRTETEEIDFERPFTNDPAMPGERNLGKTLALCIAAFIALIIFFAYLVKSATL